MGTSRFLSKAGVVGIILMLCFVFPVPRQGTAAEKPAALRVWGGTPTGAWGPLMINISELLKKTFPGVPVSIEPAGGSSAILAVDQGKGELSIAVSFTAAKAYRGTLPFKKPAANLRQMMGLFDSPMQITALADTRIGKIDDLRGKKVNFGTKGMNSEILGVAILAEYGIKLEDLKPQYLGLGSGSSSMRDGQTDTTFRGTAVPTSDIMELANARNIRMLSLSDKVIDSLLAKNPGLIRYTIPAGTYKSMDKPVNTVSAPSAFYVPASLPDETVRGMMSTVVANMPTLIQVYGQMKEVTPEKMTHNLGVPFHPGALKYYREKGWMK